MSDAQHVTRAAFGVVVVDDNPYQAAGTAALLAAGGAPFATALTPEQALAYDWACSPADVAVLDAYRPEPTTGDHFFAVDIALAARRVRPLGAADLPGAPPFVPRHRAALLDDGTGTRPLAILVLSHYADTVELGRRLWEARADALLPRDAYTDVDALVSLVRAPWLAETDSTYRDSTADRARLAVLGLAPDVRANELARIATDPHDRAVRRLLDHTDTPRMQDRPREYRSFADALRPRLAALGLRRPGWQTNGRAGASLDTVKLVLDRLTGAAHHRHRTGDPDLPTSARHLSGLANDHRTPPPRR